MTVDYEQSAKLILGKFLILESPADTGAGSNTQTEAQADVQANVTIRVGANVTPHSEILEVAKPILAEQGITLEIVVLEDSITPNTGVIEGSLDANYFQHVPYLEQFNQENNSDLVSVGAVHYEPFGVYAGKTTDLNALPEGAIVAVPNNVTNEARALLLLEQEGIIKLKDGAGITATVEDSSARRFRRPSTSMYAAISPTDVRSFSMRCLTSSTSSSLSFCSSCAMTRYYSI